MSTNKLQGKVAIVTGGASGIGEGTARLFAAHGARMVVIADIQDELGQQVAASIGSDKCSYFHCDVSEEEQVQSLVKWTVESYGKLDVMFSNAGVAGTRGFDTVLDLDLGTMDGVFAINVRGMAACVKHAARAMVDKRLRGTIVCTTSVLASTGRPQATDYCMSKHAVLGLVRSASMQLGKHGIRVNSVSPHAVATPAFLRYMGAATQEEAEKLFESDLRLKGVALKVKHVAEAVLFLACDESELITGHDLVVDGGFLMK